MDRGRNADCIPLWMYRARGAIFKGTGSPSMAGYTIIAKCIENALEQRIYRRLESLQETVCCGSIRRLPTTLLLCKDHKTN